jgi:hypothetical protein
VDIPQHATASQAVVRYCLPDRAAYRIGVQFFSDSHQFPAVPGADLDYYEVLQLSPKADLETIHRVYRIMAARFHPDNPESRD